MDTLESWRARLARPASRLVLGDAYEPPARADSWFGRVTLGEPQEQWPVSNGRLMWPLLQIVVRELPYCPPGLLDLALIRVFIDPAFLAETENGGRTSITRRVCRVQGGCCVRRRRSTRWSRS